MLLKIGIEGLVATHQHANAIVSPRQYQRRLSRLQPFRTSPAKCISQQDRVVPRIIGNVDAFLQIGVHLRTAAMQPHGNYFQIDCVFGARDDVFHFAREHLADDRFQSHRSADPSPPVHHSPRYCRVLLQR